MRNIAVAVLLGCLFGFVGCSGGGGNPMVAVDEPVRQSSGSHGTWGLWQFVADPANGTLEVTQLRAGNMHLNALQFLEPPPFLNLSLESYQFNGNLVEADIGLRHPFLGLTEFTGFDVCGIFITNGSVIGFDDPALRMAGPGDTRLLNPDGHTRWWNPSGFPYDGTMFSYKDGLLGTPDSLGNYDSTINAYKYFCDDLQNPDDPLDMISPAKRGMFSAGQKNIRHYTIEIGSAGFIFNYAIDANWVFPTGQYPWEAPADFAPEANRPEAYRLNVSELSNTLWYDGSAGGGSLSLLIDVYDWYNADLNTVRVESPGNFTSASSASAVGGGEGYSTYQVDITGATPSSDKIDLLITVESEAADYQGFLPGEQVSAYFTHQVAVTGEGPTITVLVPNGGEVWGVSTYHNITWESTGEIDFVKIEYSKDMFSSDINEIIGSTDNDGSYSWQVPDDPSDTVRVRASDTSNAAIYDISDADFTISTFAPTYWNQYMHDPRHGGQTNVTGPQSASYQWTYDGPGSNPLCVVEGFDGTIYYGTVQNSGRIEAVNPDGTEKWVYTPSMGGTWSKPLGVSTDDSVVYVGVNFSSFHGIIVGLDTSDATELWTYEAWASANTFGLILDDGDLVACAEVPDVGDGPYATIRLDQDGNEVWNKSHGFNWCTAPAQGPDGTIYIKSSPYIAALDPDTGNTTDSYAYPSGNMQTSIAVRGDGRIVFGTNTNVYCLNTDMTLFWSCSCPGSILIEGFGVGLNNEVYISYTGLLYAITEDGTVDWTWAGAVGWMSPAVGADGTIYVGTNSGVAALNPDGSTLWTYSPGGWASGPIIAHDGSLYANISSDLHKIKDP